MLPASPHPKPVKPGGVGPDTLGVKEGDPGVDLIIGQLSVIHTSFGGVSSLAISKW